MKRNRQNLLFILAVCSLTFLFSCGDDNEPITPVVTDEFDARINNFATDSLSATVFVSDVTDNVIDVLLSFTSTENMRRVYITRNIQGQGDEKLDASDAFGVNDKADGAIDLDASLQNGLAFSFDFPVSALPSGEGTVVYKFWATTGKGDFRDATKRNAVGPATLTINLGGTNPAAMLKSQTGVTLEAPTGDATSPTFISTLDCQVYRIKSGTTTEEDLEFTAFWDFGYYYLNSTGASLASPASYPNLFADPNGGQDLVNVFTFLGVDATEVNNSYFVKADAAVDFSTINTVGELTAATTASNASPEIINDLAVDDVIFVINRYGKNAILKVTSIQPGFNQGDNVVFDIKVEL